MSSPPYPGPPSPKSSPSSSNPLAYRRTDYRHGNVVRITESRRRSPMVSSYGLDQTIHPLRSLSREIPVDLSSPSLKASSQVLRAHSTRSSQQHQHQYGTLTPKSSSKPKAQAVIVQGPISVSVDFHKRDAVPRFSVDICTPPPTPRMSRLATPELDDLEERSFCDCCTGRRTAKYCAGCGYELDRCDKGWR